MAEDDPCAGLKPIDELLEWWAANHDGVCRGDHHMAKKYDDLADQITDYRRKACDLMTKEYHMERIILSIDGLRQLSHTLSQSLEADQDRFCGLWGDVQRDLVRLEAGAGFATQALVTRWFHEAGFHIADIEVEHEDSEGHKHSFDIEVKDMGGSGYDIEVWQGTGPLAYEEQRAMDRFLNGNGRPLCANQGKWSKQMEYISEYGCIGDDREANFRTLMRKMGQMREDRTGIVVACLRRNLQPWRTLIPKDWGPRLPKNRCVIALRIGDGGLTEERRGTGYLVCPPKFGHAEAAKAMIMSLKFEYTNGSRWKY